MASTVKSAWRIYGKITLILGASFFTAAAVLLAIGLLQKLNVLMIVAMSLGINGAVWTIIGTIFSLRAKYEINRHNRLKSSGLRYEAKIERIISNNHMVRMGRYVSLYAECSYKNHEGKTCLVRSNSFLLGEQITICNSIVYNAVVYVNRNNPRDYAVEISSGKNADYTFDYDYRFLPKRREKV